MRFRRIAFALASLLSSSLAFSQNRIVLPTTSLAHDAAGEDLTVLADSNQDLLGLSLAFECDPDVLLLQDLSLGADLAAVSPEWSSLDFDPDTGEVTVAVIIDFSGPTITKRLSAGQELEIATLTVDVVDPLADETSLTFLPDSGTPLVRRNVLTTTTGATIVPTLVPGEVSISTPAPRIVSLSGNSGPPGKVFSAVTDDADNPGLLVRVCGVLATFSLGADGRTLTITAPVCSQQTTMLEVCTDFGCATRAVGFTYSSTRTFLRGDVNLDVAIDLSDAISILLHLFGGFTADCEDAADVDNSESIEITDAVLILTFLFQSGAPPAAPFPLVDYDPAGVALDCAG